MTPLHPAPIVSPAEVALHWTPLITMAGYSAYALVRSTLTPRVTVRKAVASVSPTVPGAGSTFEPNSSPDPSEVTPGAETTGQASSGNPPPD